MDCPRVRLHLKQKGNNLVPTSPTTESFGNKNENKNKNKNAQGAVLMAGACRIRKFKKNKLFQGKHMTCTRWDLHTMLYDRTFRAGFDLRAVDRSVFFHLSRRPVPPAPQSLSHNVRRRRSPSRRLARGC